MNALLVKSKKKTQKVVFVALSGSLVGQLGHVLEDLADLLADELGDLCLLALALGLGGVGAGGFEILEEAGGVFVAVVNVHASVLSVIGAFVHVHVVVVVFLCVALDNALVDGHAVHGAPGAVVALNHGEDLLCAQPGSAEGLVLADEAHAEQAVPLVPADVGPVLAHLGLDAHDGGLDLGRGPEVVLADLHDVGDLGPELGVDGETAVEGIAGAGCQTEGEFALEHEDGASRRVGQREELEDEGTRDLVWSVSYHKTQRLIESYLIRSV